MRGNIYAANEVKGRDRYSRDRTQRVSRDGLGLLGCVVAVQGRCLPGLYLAATVTSPFGILLTAVRRKIPLFFFSRLQIPMLVVDTRIILWGIIVMSAKIRQREFENRWSISS
jgi:hypothetical protein